MINHSVYKKFIPIVSNYTPTQILNASHQTICNIIGININNYTSAFLDNVKNHAYSLRLRQIQNAEFIFYKQSIINGDLNAIKQKWPDYELVEEDIEGKRGFVFYPEGT